MLIYEKSVVSPFFVCLLLFCFFVLSSILTNYNYNHNRHFLLGHISPGYKGGHKLPNYIYTKSEKWLCNNIVLVIATHTHAHAAHTPGPAQARHRLHGVSRLLTTSLNGPLFSVSSLSLSLSLSVARLCQRKRPTLLIGCPAKCGTVGKCEGALTITYAFFQVQWRFILWHVADKRTRLILTDPKPCSRVVGLWLELTYT